MIRGIATCCSRPILKLLMGKNPMVTPGEPLEQVITPRGPFMVSLNLAMKDEPNIGLRSHELFKNPLNSR